MRHRKAQSAFEDDVAHVDETSPSRPVISVCGRPQVTDVPVERGRGLTKLQSLDLVGTKITNSAVVLPLTQSSADVEGLTQFARS